MKKTLIVAGLISAAGVVMAAPAGAAPDSTVSCSPVIMCTVNANVGQWTGSVGGFATEGPKQFQNSIMTGPSTFQKSVTDFVTNGPKTFVNSVTDPSSIE
jgi:hypothetical protein